MLFRRYKRRWLYLLLSLVTVFSISVTAPTPKALALPWYNLLNGVLNGAQLIQLSNVSDTQEIKLGKQINQQILTQEFQPYQNREVNEYVNQVGQKLVPFSDRPNIPYKFQVVKDNSINAFATMGGYVYVTTGLLKAADNEAQLASVLGHEMGHVGARHVLKQMRQTALVNGLSSAAGLNQNTAVNLGVQLAIALPGSRQHEFEADHRGFNTIRKEGYAEEAMPEFMKKLLKLPSPPTFLSTHPAVPDRITALNKYIQSSPANSCSQNSSANKCGLNSSLYKEKVQPLLAANS